MVDRIIYGDVGDLDEVFVSSPKSIQLERMGDGCFWMNIDNGSENIVIWLTSKGTIRGKADRVIEISPQRYTEQVAEAIRFLKGD